MEVVFEFGDSKRSHGIPFIKALGFIGFFLVYCRGLNGTLE